MDDNVEFGIKLEHHGLDSKLFVPEKGIQTHPCFMQIPQDIEDDNLRWWQLQTALGKHLQILIGLFPEEIFAFICCDIKFGQIIV